MGLQGSEGFLLLIFTFLFICMLMGLQGSEGMSIRICRNLNICMLMSTRLRMGDTCNGKLKVYLYAYRIAKFHVFCKIIEFVCKNNIFNIVTTLGESASGQQWQIDIGTCTVRTRARRQRTISPCIYMMTICILMESQGSEGAPYTGASGRNICILMESQGSEGDRTPYTKADIICILMESQGSEGSDSKYNLWFCICILIESQGSEGVNKKNANLIYICILMGSQGSEGDQNDHM